MPNEADHLAMLRESLEEMEHEPGKDPAVDKAIKVLLRVAIAHHEGAAASPVEQAIENPPSFMESGEDLHPPIDGAGGPMVSR